MVADATTTLGYALLGLIGLRPSSGYDLRKIFAETAMGSYSSSPGAIYPALRRLEKLGLIKGSVQATGGMRRRCVYHLTRKGQAELTAWLSQPIKPSDVRRGTEELMLRFSYLEANLGQASCVSFLKELRAALTPYIAELERFIAANGAKMPLSARLALDSGIRGYRSLRNWTEYALQTYLDLNRKSNPTKPRRSSGGAS